MIKALYLLTLLSALMLMMGIILVFTNIELPRAVWNILQIGGLVGLIIFGPWYKSVAKKKKTH